MECRGIFEHGLYMFYTYVLESLKTGKKYIGFSADLKRRVEEHNKEKAVAREKYFKTGFGRRYLKERL
jgi:predicted GIY-YIG superfamily endonuclease